MKFDNRGNNTHDQKQTRDFTTLDYCVRCKEPKFDSYGNKTHAQNDSDFLNFPNIRKNHKFISGINAKNNEKKRKQKNIPLYIILTSGCTTVIFNLPNIIF